jgi:hypothetical protein
VSSLLAIDVVIECAHVVMSGQQTPLLPVSMPLSLLRIALALDIEIASLAHLFLQQNRPVCLKFEVVGSATTTRAEDHKAKRPRVAV